MKRMMFVGLVALGLAFATQPAQADCSFEYGCSRHFSYTHTTKSRCFTYSSQPHPIACAGGGAPAGYGGAPVWGGYNPYAVPAYGVAPAAPVAAAPAKSPAFSAPQPTLAPKSPLSQTGLQQAAYFYYPPTTNLNSGYAAGYGYGYGYGYGNGAGYYQAPSYWYGE